MKLAKWMIPLTLVLLSGLMAAQSLNKTLVAQVPFEFMVGNKVMPAGEYVVQATDANILTIQNFEARKSALSTSARADENASNRTAMVFDRFGSQYVLAEIRIEGSDLTYKLPESGAQAELRAQSAPVSVTLLAVLK